MTLPESRQQSNLLFDFYGELLTPKQREVFAMYYMDDHSLSEIGAALGISSPAVSDMLKRVNSRLARYDKLLKMSAQFENQQAIAAEINAVLNQLAGDVAPSQKAELIAQIRNHLTNLFDF